MEALTGPYFSTLSQGMFAIVLSFICLLLFLLAMGLLSLLAIKTGRALAVHIGIAAREPREKIVRRYRAKIRRQTETARAEGRER